MAKVHIEGEVSRVNQSGNGFGVKEVQEFGGKSRTTYWSVFPPKNEQRTVNVGDRVKVNGFLGTRVSERDARYVDHTINGARVEGGQQQAPADESWSTPGWDTTQPGTSETPF